MATRYAYGQHKTATLTAKPDFDAEKEAEALREAMKGFGTDEQALIDVVGNLSEDQRLVVMDKYKGMFGRDLVEDIESEVSGHFQKALVMLFEAWADRFARLLHDAMAGAGTTESEVIEILCTLTNGDLKAVKEAYQKKYDKSLEDAITGDFSGDTQKLLVALVAGVRDEVPNEDIEAYLRGSKSLRSIIDLTKVREDVASLYDAGAGKCGTDEEKFIHLLGSRSEWHLMAVAEVYQEEHEQSLFDAIKSEMSGDLSKALRLSLVFQCSPVIAFAELLDEAMRGAGTADDKLIRIIVSRAEVDLDEIKREFATFYEKPLGEAISEDTSGDYKRLLLCLARE